MAAPPALPLRRSPEFQPLLAVECIDQRGRIPLHDAVLELDWSVGSHLVCVVTDWTAVLRPCADSNRALVIGKDRRVTITRAVWFGLGLRTGDRVAVVSDRDADEVRLIPPARLVGRGV